MPLDTLRPTISPEGISAPTYADILSSLQDSYRSIYGSDAYLEPDSQDGQLLAIFAAAIHDGNQAIIAVFNGYSPTYAQGAALSSYVKINGIARLVSSNSEADVLIVGQVGTIINNGVVEDVNAVLWDLPSPITIPVAGQIVVTAVCEQEGAIQAPAHSIIKIRTPTRGWQTVDNPQDAVVGAPVESDAKLRSRQSVSVALPALTSLEGIVAAVANVDGVQRYAAYDNDTNLTDTNGIPPHSIAVVTQGGDAQEIATTIADKKSPGTGTYGSTVETVFDKYGLPTNIAFFELALVTVSVTISLRALTGYAQTTADFIQASVAKFISDLSIGEICYLSRLWAPANLSGDAATDATGLTQIQLDALSRTFAIASISINRSNDPPDTTAIHGPYAAGAVNITVADNEDFYVGCPIQITLDDATLLSTKVDAITSGKIVIHDQVPVNRQVLDGAAIYMTQDVVIAFNEGAAAASSDVSITVT